MGKKNPSHWRPYGREFPYLREISTPNAFIPITYVQWNFAFHQALTPINRAFFRTICLNNICEWVGETLPRNHVEFSGGEDLWKIFSL